MEEITIPIEALLITVLCAITLFAIYKESQNGNKEGIYLGLFILALIIVGYGGVFWW